MIKALVVATLLATKQGDNMIPISQIKIGDMFQNPLFPNGNIYIVEDIKGKMIKVQAYNFYSFRPISRPFWKKNTDQMFSESWKLK